MNEIIRKTDEIRRALEETAEGGTVIAWTRSEFLGQWSQTLTYKLHNGGELSITLREPTAPAVEE